MTTLVNSFISELLVFFDETSACSIVHLNSIKSNVKILGSRTPQILFLNRGYVTQKRQNIELWEWQYTKRDTLFCYWKNTTLIWKSIAQLVWILSLKRVLFQYIFTDASCFFSILNYNSETIRIHRCFSASHFNRFR